MGSTKKKKDAWRKWKPITIYVCFVFGIESCGEGQWGGPKAHTLTGLYSLFPHYSSVDRQFFYDYFLSPCCPGIHHQPLSPFPQPLIPFDSPLLFQAHTWVLPVPVYLSPAYLQMASFSTYSLCTFLPGKIGINMNAWFRDGGRFFLHFHFSLLPLIWRSHSEIYSFWWSRSFFSHSPSCPSP